MCASRCRRSGRWRPRWRRSPTHSRYPRSGELWADARRGVESKDAGREERRLGDPLVGDSGSARAYTPLAQFGRVVGCHGSRHRRICCCSRAREHRRFRRLCAIVEQERRASVLVENNGDAVQRKAALDERDGALGRVSASVLCCVPNLGRRGSCARSIWLSRLPHRDLPPSEPCEGPRCVNYAQACGCGGC